jgi:hypothetical protein
VFPALEVFTWIANIPVTFAAPQNPKLGISVVSGSLPSVDEAGIMAVKISEMVEPPLTAQEQSFFIAGFCECVKWLGSNDR